MSVKERNSKMITTVDKNDCWFWSDAEMLYGEDGSRRPVECSDIIFTHGKYEGSLLSEVGDSWYLNFIKNKNLDDYFMKTLFDKRLGELK